MDYDEEEDEKMERDEEDLVRPRSLFLIRRSHCLMSSHRLRILIIDVVDYFESYRTMHIVFHRLSLTKSSSEHT